MTHENETRDELLDQLAELEADEPDCDCRQCDVDEYDPLGCEYHDGHSAYNVEHRRLEAAILALPTEQPMTYKQAIEAINRDAARIRAIAQEIVDLPDLEVA